MQRLTNTFKQFIGNRKMNTLWNEYKKAAKLGDTVLKNKKLNSFLAQFKQVALNYLEQQKGNPKFEKLFTEIADLLSILIDQVSQYDCYILFSFDEKNATNKEPDIRAYFRNILQSIELILKDPAYRTQLQSSTMFLTQLVGMLNNIDDEEAKLILIKLMGILGKSLENKVIIGKNNGFRKLLGLMLEQNEDIFKEIIDAFKQMLDVTNDKEDPVANTVAPPDISSLSTAEIRSMLNSEMITSDNQAPIGPKNPKEPLRPSLEVLRKMSLEMSDDDREDDPGASSDVEDKKERVTCLSLFKAYEENPFEESKKDSIAEEMVIQGTLETLKGILLTTRRELQTDLMQIIAKLLVKSTYNQHEFQKIEGYFVLAVMLNQKRDYTDLNERKNLRSCVQILKKIIYNDEPDKLVKNIEAFKVLLSLISTSHQVMTVQEALLLLNEILNANIRNCFVFLKMFGFLDLHILLLRLLFPESDYISLIKTNFCLKNNIEKLTALCNCLYVRREEIVDTQILGESVKKTTEAFETNPLAEKDKIDLFTLLDQLIMSLCYILNPLNIMPCAQLYSQVLSSPIVNLQFYKCLLDRLELMIMEKLTKVNAKDYEGNIYCSDLEQVLANFAVALTSLHKEIQSKAKVRELFNNTLALLHKFLVFTSSLQYYVKPNSLQQNHLSLMYELVPDILEFLYNLPSSYFADDPFHAELVYSLIELMIYSSHPCPPVLKFMHRQLLKSDRWNYHDLLMLNFGLYSSCTISEALVQENQELLQTKSPKPIDLFIMYMLCRDSYKNKLLLESIIEPLDFVKKVEYDKMNEDEQWFVLTIFRSLVNFINDLTVVDYSVLTINMNQKEIEAINSMRSKINQECNDLIYNAKVANEFEERPQLVNLRNVLVIFIAETNFMIQAKTLEVIGDDLNNSLTLCNEWMNSEIIDYFLEIFAHLESAERPLKLSYLKVIAKILNRGVSLAKTDLFYNLFNVSNSFRQSLLDILESEDLPLSLHIVGNAETGNSGVYTSPLKSFPRERVGFSIEFWAKFPLVAPSIILFEFLDASKIIFSWKYLVELQVTEHKKEEDDSARSSTKGGILKHYIQIETEDANNKIELEVPLLQADKLSHIVFHYSKNSYAIYIDGKQALNSAGTPNPYPMTFVKNIYLRLSNQSKVVSPVTIYEGMLDKSVIANLWFRGPLDEYMSIDKKLGIDLTRVYRFPKPSNEPLEQQKSQFAKLIISSVDLKLPEAEVGGNRRLEIKNFPFVLTTTQAQPQYLAKLNYLPNSEYQTSNTKSLKSDTQLYECMGTTKALLCHTFTLKQFLSSAQFVKLLLNRLTHAKNDELSTLLQILKLLFIHNEGFVTSLKDINIPSFLLSLHLKNQAIENTNDQYCIIETFLDIFLSYKNTLKAFNVFSKPSLLIIPTSNKSRLHYFRSVEYLTLISHQPQRECILNTLSILLYSQENMERFSDEGLQLMLICLLKEVGEKSGSPDNFMYEKLLEIFQLYFYFNHTLDWELLYSFFLSLKEKGSPDILIDILSIMSIYILISTNKFVIAEKFMSTNGFKMFYVLLGSTNVLVVEQSIKLLNVLLIANPKLKQVILKVHGFDIIAHKLSAIVPTFTFLQTLLDFAFGSMKVQSLYPENNSYVSTVINRSPIANEVLSYTAGGAKLELANPEIFEVFFTALSRTRELHYRINMLRQLEPIVNSGKLQHNPIELSAQKMIDSGLFVWIVEYFKVLESEQKSMLKEVEVESLSKIVKMSIKFVVGIIHKELEKPSKNFKLVKILQMIPSVDHIQTLILNRLLKNFCKKIALKNEPDNCVKNLATLFISLNNIMTVSDSIKFGLVKTINVLASMNTAEVRAQMKKSNLFNYRDALLLELLNSEIQTAETMEALQQISLEAIAGVSKFRDSKTIENLLSWVIESKDNNLRNSFLTIFQKQVCIIPDNLKYVGKLFEDQVLVGLLTTKSLEEITEYLNKNSPKDIEKILKITRTQNANRRAQQAKEMNERSQKRNKVYAELNKEKANIQSIVNEYNKSEAKYLKNISPEVVEKKIEELTTSCKKAIEDTNLE